jgi:hypothetical protein
MEDAWDCLTLVCHNPSSDIIIVRNDRRRLRIIDMFDDILITTVTVIHICKKA